MSTFTIFWTWSTGDVLTAARLNGNNNNFVTQGNSIDRTNMGSAGIDASSLKPASAGAATFGGTQIYTLPAGTALNTNANATVPVTIAGNSGGGQTGHLLDVLLQPAGTNFFAVDANGAMLPNGNGTIPAASVAIGADAGATKGLRINLPTGSTNGLQVSVNGTNLLQMSATGDLQVAPLINALNTLTRAVPVYTTTGGGVAGTLHAVFGSNALSSNTVTITLSNAAVFTNAASYIVVATESTSTQGLKVSVASGSQFTISNGGGGPTDTVQWLAIGT